MDKVKEETKEQMMQQLTKTKNHMYKGAIKNLIIQVIKDIFRLDSIEYDQASRARAPSQSQKGRSIHGQGTHP